MSYALTELGWDSHFAAALAENIQAAGETADSARWQPARVMAVHRGHLDVVTEAGEASLPVAMLATGDEVTAGDWIVLDAAQRLIARLPRKSLFRRRAAGTGREWQLIAANVDVLFIVTSCNQDFNVARLERYLVLAQDAGVWPVIVLTKTDLCDDADEFAAAAAAIQPGLVVEPVNALDSRSVAALFDWCTPGQTVALLGSSGVGKSTLLNTLAGSPLEATGSIREDDDKGRHTTTTRTLHRLPNGGWLLDTPGMRELQLAEVHEGIEQVFDDISRLSGQCRFSDCLHESEPGCAVQEAIADGSLDPGRLQRYRKLQREDDRNTETLAERHQREREFGRMVKRIISHDKRG